nr:hypothetical protein FNV92_16865 [Bradyrhizobium cosmicum]
MPRLGRGIQSSAADVVRARSLTSASGRPHRPVEPGDDKLGVAPSTSHVLVRIRIMKLSKLSSATWNHGSASAR